MKTGKKKMQKVIENGKVAVLVSPGYGAGWSTWNGFRGIVTAEELMFDPTIVKLTIQKDLEEITSDQHYQLVEAYCTEKWGKDTIYCGGVDDLEIVWIPQGTLFKINEYDGSESIEYKENDNWVVA